jgi:hypothetical protein
MSRKLVAQRTIETKKEPHTTIETLLIPAFKELVKTVPGPEAASEISLVPPTLADMRQLNNLEN